jgi:solute:Na+ symporter, SSS family
MLAWIAALLTMALGSIPQQDVFQRVNSSKNERVAVWGTTIGGVSYFFFAAVPLFLAYSATLIDPAMVERFMEEDSQLILPNLIIGYMPFAAQVVFFGALISVIMSTASGTLLAPSVTFSENILRGYYRDMTDRQLLLATRLAVVAFTSSSQSMRSPPTRPSITWSRAPTGSRWPAPSCRWRPACSGSAPTTSARRSRSCSASALG